MLKWRCVPERTNMATAPPDVTAQSSATSSGTGGSSTITPEADDSSSRSSFGRKEIDFQWGEEIEGLETFQDDDKLPCVSKFQEDSTRGGKIAPGLKIYANQPLLLYRRVRKRQARTRTIYHDKSGAYFEVGQTILIPDDYTGE